jgi:hypothetical protein
MRSECVSTAKEAKGSYHRHVVFRKTKGRPGGLLHGLPIQSKA